MALNNEIITGNRTYIPLLYTNTDNLGRDIICTMNKFGINYMDLFYFIWLYLILFYFSWFYLVNIDKDFLLYSPKQKYKINSTLLESSGSRHTTRRFFRTTRLLRYCRYSYNHSNFSLCSFNRRYTECNKRKPLPYYGATYTVAFY